MMETSFKSLSKTAIPNFRIIKLFFSFWDAVGYDSLISFRQKLKRKCSLCTNGALTLNNLITENKRSNNTI